MHVLEKMKQKAQTINPASTAEKRNLNVKLEVEGETKKSKNLSLTVYRLEISSQREVAVCKPERHLPCRT